MVACREWVARLPPLPSTLRSSCSSLRKTCPLRSNSSTNTFTARQRATTATFVATCTRKCRKGQSRRTPSWPPMRRRIAWIPTLMILPRECSLGPSVRPILTTSMDSRTVLWTTVMTKTQLRRVQVVIAMVISLRTRTLTQMMMKKLPWLQRWVLTMTMTMRILRCLTTMLLARPSQTPTLRMMTMMKTKTKKKKKKSPN
mmetsp:Transcript_6631/g.11677  ORF Transcript_6631/g.11677 Transcript_6631/m.11677 type:complete len:200 (-) Transcript_6631:387-986(-)